MASGLEDYEKIAVLGAGALAQVHLAKRNQDGRYFALKVMDKKRIIKMKQLEHIHNEKSLLEEVDHPFIIKLEATFQDEKSVYLVLEYCHGGDLFGLMGMYDDEILPMTEARFYSACIVSVFEHIHSKSIIYRDLKTENLLLDRQGFLKVADFGFAKKLDDGNRTWTLCGTPEHLAPEIIQNKGHNKAADWWTLGINMFEFLAGEPPFNASTPIGTYRLIVAGKFEYPPDFDENAKSIISHFLTADPEARFGCTGRGVEDVMAHPFFAPTDFGQLFRRELKAPFTPEVEDDEDISNFEEPEDTDDGIDTSEISIDAKDFDSW